MAPTDDERLDAARRALAGLKTMLAVSVATKEALERQGDADLIEMFANVTDAIRLLVNLAEHMIKRREKEQ